MDCNPENSPINNDDVLVSSLSEELETNVECIKPVECNAHLNQSVKYETDSSDLTSSSSKVYECDVNTGDPVFVNLSDAIDSLSLPYSIHCVSESSETESSVPHTSSDCSYSDDSLYGTTEERSTSSPHRPILCRNCETKCNIDSERVYFISNSSSLESISSSDCYLENLDNSSYVADDEDSESEELSSSESDIIGPSPVAHINPDLNNLHDDMKRCFISKESHGVGHGPDLLEGSENHPIEVSTGSSSPSITVLE